MEKGRGELRIGIISDTHNLLRPEVFSHFADVDHILHAGDVGEPEILTELEAIAPVSAVWGNTDGWKLRNRLPEVAELDLAGVATVVLHGHQLGSPTPEKAVAAHPRARLIVFGHSHRPLIREVRGALAVNPGSAGPRRFGSTPTLALGRIADGRVTAELVGLEPPSPI